MGGVVNFPAPASIDAAWESYAELARQLTDDPRLLHDRAHQEAMAKAHDRWKQLFMAKDRVG